MNKRFKYNKLVGNHTIPTWRNFFPDVSCAMLMEGNQTRRTMEHRGDTVPYDLNNYSIEQIVFRYEPNLN